MHDASRVQHLQALSDRPAYTPYFLLLDNPLVFLRLVDQIGEEVALLSILHHQVEVPVSMLVLFEEAVEQVDEVSGG